VLHSYQQGLGWTDRITEGIKSALNDTDKEIELYFEYMDTKRIYDDQHIQNLRELYRHKYRNRRFDVIISSDDYAFRFLLAHHRELFSGTPIVFCGVNNFKDSMLLGHDLITGIMESFDIKGSLEVALQLHPNAKEVFVIVDKTLSGSIVKEMVTKAIPYFKNVSKFSFLEGLDMSEVLERVKNLSNESIVFLISLLIDKSENLFTFESSCALISQKSAVPIYSHSDAHLVHGIMGGKLNCGDAQGQVAGDMASRILHGEEVNNIPVVKKSLNRYRFDYEQMQRFGVDLSTLPEGSTVINRPYSFYSKHKGLIWSVVANIAGLVLIILILSINIFSRRRAEQALRESEENFRELAEKSPSGVVIADSKANQLYVNKRYAEITGYSIDELIGMNGFEVLTRLDDKRKYIEMMKKRMKGKLYRERYERILFRKDGTEVLTEFITTKTRWKGEICPMAIVLDVTKRKQAEKALRESELRLRYLSFQLISAQEEERKRISLELHDEMGQVLTAVGINLESIGKELAPEHDAMIKDKLAETISLVEQASDRVRDLSLDLRPSMLDDLGLLPTLRWYINSYEKRTETPVIFEAVNLGERLAPEVEIALYRIVQESLNNITKHALAKKVKIRFEQKKKKVGILIEDDGIGFYPERVMNETTPVKRIGLIGMQERVRLLEGSFRVRSHKGQGTSIFVELPLH